MYKILIADDEKKIARNDERLSCVKRLSDRSGIGW